MAHIVEELCQQLDYPKLTQDLEKLERTRQLLTRAQHREVFDSIFVLDVNSLDLPAEPVYKFHHSRAVQKRVKKSKKPGSKAIKQISIEDDVFEYMDECECCAGIGKLEPAELEETPENVWLGYFPGFDVLTERHEVSLSDNKKCIELTIEDTDESLEAVLRQGVRCFMIDLFVGTSQNHQAMILRLRENELKIAKEFGFPIVTTLFAKLTSRYQYTGDFEPPQTTAQLEPGDELKLTTNRSWSACGVSNRVYVNARFLLEDVRPCDFIFIGPDIQVQVQDVRAESLNCIVVEGGVLKARMPVLFPCQCKRFRVSLEELEDITFAREVGINVVVSHIVGSQEYYDNMKECLSLLECTKMRLFARVVVNDLLGCDFNLDWAIKNYDGYFIEVDDKPTDNEHEILHICPKGLTFLDKAYHTKKPILLRPAALAYKYRLLIDPTNYRHIYYYPDRFIFTVEQARQAFQFFWLQSIQAEKILKCELSEQPFCDVSHTGTDIMARSCVAAAYEANVKVILVCSLTGRMAIKIAHFRPNIPIVLLTTMKSAEDFMSLYHNVIMLSCCSVEKDSYRKIVYRQLTFGLIYAFSQNMIAHNDNVILVYGYEAGTKFPDMFVTYKFDKAKFAQHLCKILFT